MKRERPMIVQSDMSVLLEVGHPLYEDARDALNRFAELVKSPEHIHTYRITMLSLWNAAASGMNAEDVISSLEAFSRYEIPQNVIANIRDWMSRYGRLKLLRYEEDARFLLLRSDDELLLREIMRSEKVRPFLEDILDRRTALVKASARGLLKKALTELGFPAEDLVGYAEGERFRLRLLRKTRSGEHFELRKYQREAVEAFYAGGSPRGGSGVIVLPCGAGKTIVGIAIMEKLQTNTLIITTSTVASRQWKAELLDKTDVSEEDIGEYSGEKKEIKPITIATYQILTHRHLKSEEFPHFSLFNERNWGLIIYDEVHLLPAPVFRITAELQAKRRLGLTATLVREDGRETDVFSLIGPKKYDAPWKELERQGWIAKAICHEIRAEMSDEMRMKYALAPEKQKFRIASAENERKYEILRGIVRLHHARGDKILVIGTYLEQLKRAAEILASEFKVEMLTGKTPTKKRMRAYSAFKRGDLDVIVVSKVANFAIDLPNANVAIQISGTFGSRQEEAQRLGRILRPKKDGSPAFFYSIVSKDTKEQDLAAKRQLFLTEQGYKYIISDFPSSTEA
ncbi:MAG: DEAD/DEAH box helicase [Candidatus Methanospirare jalkutatii]|nr:DEAD/DEAH box helicase [Candidatus Methanospirare jalkutatii]